MNCTRYPSLVSMLSAQAQSTNAFEYFEKGERKAISYGEFISLMQAYPLPKEKIIGIFASTTFEAVLAIFSLIGKKRVVLLSPDDPMETLEAQIKKTHIGKLIGDEELAEEEGMEAIGQGMSIDDFEANMDLEGLREGLLEDKVLEVLREHTEVKPADEAPAALQAEEELPVEEAAEAVEETAEENTSEEAAEEVTSEETEETAEETTKEN